MSIYKPKGSPFYYFDFWRSGRRVYGTTGTASRREAESIERAAKDEAEAEAKKARGRKGRPMTIDEAAGRFWEEVGQHMKRPDQVEFALGWIVAAIGKDTPIRHINNDIVARIVAKRRTEFVRNVNVEKARRNGVDLSRKLVSPTTVNRTVIEPLREILNRSRDLWGQEIQPILWKEHRLKEPRERVRELSQDEEDRLFFHLPEVYHPTFRFALATGFRLSECVNLTWDRVDWGNRILTVLGKGDKEATIPMTPGVRELLWPLRGDHPTRVFTLAPGKPMGVWAVNSARYRACEDARIANFRFHDLRHTAATRLLRSSGNLKLVQRLLRHGEITTTTRYAHALDTDLREKMEAQEAARSPKISPKQNRKTLRRKGLKRVR